MKLACEALLIELTRELRAVRPLVRALGRPARIPRADSVARSLSAGEIAVVRCVSEAVGVDAPEFTPTGHAATSFDGAVALRLGAGLEGLAHTDLSAVSLLAASQLVASELASADDWLTQSTVVSRDASALRVYTAGNPEHQPVLVVLPCGMPVELAARWLRALAARHHVITWESRGLFPAAEQRELRTDVAAQAEDALAVLEHCGINPVHVMGLCGGAVVAAAAVASGANRVASLSLWHGDFAGCTARRTNHQQDVAEAMLMAGESREQARAMYGFFSRPLVLNGLRNDLAHFLLVPYATPELLYRYGQLNGSIMQQDLNGIAQQVPVPVFVLTSEDDVTAHPDGSRHAATLFGRATLHVEPHGDHLSLFDAPPKLTELANRVIAEPFG